MSRTAETALPRRTLVVGLALLISGASATSGCEAETETAPELEGMQCNAGELTDVYNRYVQPIMDLGEGQSCIGCHAPGINLNVFEKESPCHTMACLEEGGMVSFEDPESSQVLEFIRFGMEQDSMREQAQREYEGFLQIIRYSASCGLDACGEMSNPCDSQAPPPTSGAGGSTSTSGAGAGSTGGPMIGSCAEQDVVDLFTTNVFQNVMGCKACHEKSGKYANDDDPGWWIVLNNPKSTLYSMIAEAGMFSAVAPATSEIVTKPLPEGEPVSSTLGTFVGVEHVGGPKLVPGTPKFPATFASIVEFLEFYADCMNN